VKVERIAAKQAHWVPSQAHAPRGPFSPELFQHTPVVWDYTPQGENGDVEEPIGATAQNNYRPLRHFMCRDCDTVMTEHEIYDHDCDDDGYEDEPEGLPDGKI
jgi:hypothetical protein